MTFYGYLTTPFTMMVNRLMWLTGGVKFPIRFMIAERDNTRPGITAAGRMMIEGEDFYWYTDRGGRVFILAKW